MMVRALVSAIILLGMTLYAFGQSETDVDNVNDVTISATIRTYVLSAPRASAEFVRSFEAGAPESAFGRDEDGNWLRILDGWVLAEVLRGQGEIAELPDVTASINVKVTEATQLYAGPSAKWFDIIGEVEADTEALAIGRNEGGGWLRLPGGWIEVDNVNSSGDIRPLPVLASPGVVITAKARTFILAEPDLGAEFVEVFEAGDEALATGRAGDWLQIDRGWVSAEAVEVSGDAQSLPFAAEAIMITALINTGIRQYDDGRFVSAREMLSKGEQITAFARIDSARYVLTERGWLDTNYILADGDIIALPVVSPNNSTSKSTTSTSTRPTPAPAPATSATSSWNSSAIHSLVSRHTDDIRILDIEIASSATTIEYDLKPWPFVPNEQIANEVAFKIICALRNGQEIPNTLKFIGQSHFKSDVGRKFTSPSVEIHISARNANRIVCRGNSYSDINWRSLASLYKSYPIPRGASVDYD